MCIYEGHEPYIFISYSHDDTKRVLPMIRYMQQQGYRLWYDEGIKAGTEWPDYVAEHLVKSEWVIAFISKNAIDSQNCRQEIFMARNREKNMLVVYLEKTDLPIGMEMMLGPLHALYCENHSNDIEVCKTLASAKMIQSCKGSELESNSNPVPSPIPKKLPMPKKLIIGFVMLALIVLVAIVFFSGKGLDSSSDAPVTAETKTPLDISHAVETEESSEVFQEAAHVELTLANADIGDYVAFGRYEQDNDTSNGAEEIRWKVLDKQEDSLLLISEKCLDVYPYHITSDHVTWDKCSMRKWLNTTFAGKAFDQEELSRIIPVKLTTPGDPDFPSRYPEVHTTDYVYLLNIEEVAEYMPLQQDRITSPSAYALARGYDVQDSGNCWWFLRSPGSFFDADAVASGGNIIEGGILMNSSYFGPRPVIRITTGSKNVEQLGLARLNPEDFTL